MPPVLDACCGGRMMWFNRQDPLAVFVDKRKESMTLCDGRMLEVNPDVIADFTKLPFEDSTFYLVVFDPPHMDTLGKNSWLAKKYGRLIGDWETELSEGFSECWRVLKPNGTLIFKWNTTDIPISRILALTTRSPLFGHTTAQKTHWMCFFKTAHD